MQVGGHGGGRFKPVKWGWARSERTDVEWWVTPGCPSACATCWPSDYDLAVPVYFLYCK